MNIALLSVSMLLLSVLSNPTQAELLPFRNPELSDAKRAKDLVDRLTIEEKAGLLYDVSKPVPRLGIKTFNWWSEALHGLANNNNVTVFPEPIGMAASFNEALVQQVFDAASDEVRAKYHDMLRNGGENKRFLSLSVWTPNVNIFRDPRWGRGQETYGEDPFLTARMGTAVVRGLQGPADARYRKLLACAKHFAVHSGPEWSRHTLNVNNLDPRDLWETYLPAFKTLVQDADVREVMCAYQRLDDEPCCGSNRLLQRILREDWGFKYLVVSDCGAVTDFYTTHRVSSDPVHATDKAIRAGTDVECAWDSYTYSHIPEAVQKGLLSTEELDRHLTRVLEGRFSLGEMDDDALVPWSKIPASSINDAAKRRLALEMSRQTMTLLQNTKNILPLSKSMGKLAVIGPNADDKTMLWGNYNGEPVRTISILDGIRGKLGSGRVVYEKACDLVEDKVTEPYFQYCSFEGTKGFKATFWNTPDRSGPVVATSSVERPLKITTAGGHEFAPGVKEQGFSATYVTDFTAPETGAIVFKLGVTGSIELYVDGKNLSRFNNWRTVPTRATYAVEKGKTYRIEFRFSQLQNWTANLEFNFGKENDIRFDDLLAKLKGVETVVFVGGLSGVLEGEEMPVSQPGFKGGDRTDIELPQVQRNCLSVLRKAGKKVVFVNCSGSAIALVPETQSCDAILQAWYGGESGGQAVADVLFGDYNPSGKLPVTFYKNVGQLPDFEDYRMKGRTYRFMDDALFPFGFGLSYTTFRIGEASVTQAIVRAGGAPEFVLRVPVTNTGKRNGAEVVQVYVRMLGDTEGPLKSLKGYQRVEVPAGKMLEAVISLPYDAFATYDRQLGKLRILPGEYEILYGTSSAEKDLKSINLTL
jgi:beta-glucosidase